MAYHYSTVVSPWSVVIFFVFKQKTAYEMRISDWSSDVCLPICARRIGLGAAEGAEALQCRTALPAHHVLDGMIDRAGVRLDGDPVLRPQHVEIQRRHQGGHGGAGRLVAADLQAVAAVAYVVGVVRSEERRVGKGCVSTCSFWGA